MIAVLVFHLTTIVLRGSFYIKNVTGEFSTMEILDELNRLYPDRSFNITIKLDEYSSSGLPTRWRIEAFVKVRNYPRVARLLNDFTGEELLIVFTDET